MENKRVRILISGIVQGVFFRYSTRIKAEELSIKGWVKNCGDGKVEAIFEGMEGNIVKMIEWCRQGPMGACVDDLVVEWQEYRGEFEFFVIK